MRWLKLIAILFLWLFFFVVLALVHLWISGLRLPNRWKIVSRWMRGFTRSMRAIINIKVTVEGDAGQLGGGGYVIEHSYMSTLGSYRGEKVVSTATGRMENLQKSTLVWLAARGIRSKSNTSSISQMGSGWSTMRLSTTSASSE